MASQAKNLPSPFHSITPALVVRDAAAAVEYYQQAFGATEIMPPLKDPSGKIAHAELRIGDSVIMLSDENPDWGSRSPQTIGGSPVVLALYVDNADDVFDRAVSAGGKALAPMKDQFYGDRSGRIQDPFGHVWIVGMHKEDVPAAVMQERWEEISKRK